jgi:hypothetical protein
MVLLRPLFDGEHVKSCTGCGQVGLASPIPERSNFCPHRRVADPLLIRYEGRCRSCHRRRNRAYN